MTIFLNKDLKSFFQFVNGIFLKLLAVQDLCVQFVKLNRRLVLMLFCDAFQDWKVLYVSFFITVLKTNQYFLVETLFITRVYIGVLFLKQVHHETDYFQPFLFLLVAQVQLFYSGDHVVECFDNSSFSLLWRDSDLIFV